MKNMKAECKSVTSKMRSRIQVCRKQINELNICLLQAKLEAK